MRLHASGVCHSDYNAVDGTAATRCPAVLGHEGAGVVEAAGEGVGRRARHARDAVVDARLRALRGVRARPGAPVRRGLGRHGARRAARRHAAPLARRRAALPLLASCRRSPSAPSSPRLLHPDPGRRAVRRRRARRLRGRDRAPARSGARRACVPATASPCSAAAASGMSAVLGAVAAGADPIVAVDVARAKLEAALELGATARGRVGRRRRTRPAERVRAVERAAASTTRSRPPGGPRRRGPRSSRRARAARRC